MRTLTLVVLLLVTVLCCQCSFKWGYGSFDGDGVSGGSSVSAGSSASGGGEVTPLPEPAVWYVPPQDLTPEQAARKNDVEHYLAELYRDYDIVEATQGYSGDIFYWARSDTLPDPYLAPPAVPWTAADLAPPSGAELGRSELELYHSDLGGPPGTTPIHRPDFWNYIMGETTAASLQDYLENYQVSGSPGGPNRLYAGLGVPISNNGISGNVSQFQMAVEKGSFSLIELAVGCPKQGLMVEQIGVALSVDAGANKFGDGKLRLHVEYMTQGPKKFGDGIGGWDDDQKGFVPYRDRKYGPGGIVPASVPGLKHYEHRLDIFQSPARDWWIAHNGNLLGYYPAKLFKMLNSGACWAAWYGEVFDPTPDVWTWTDMGNGQFAAVGYPNIAYVRNPKLHSLVATSWFPADTFVAMPTYAPKCYTRTYLSVGGAPWEVYFFLGGPGGDAAGCD